MPPDPPIPEMKYGPTLTTVHESDNDLEPARTSVARLVSALVWHHDVLIDARRFNTSGETDPLHRPVHVEVHAFPGTTISPAPESIQVAADERLRLALAVFREAVNASTPYLAYLAFYNAIDTAFDGNRRELDTFINDEASGARGIEEYIQRVTSGLATPSPRPGTSRRTSEALDVMPSLTPYGILLRSRRLIQTGQQLEIVLSLSRRGLGLLRGAPSNSAGPIPYA
jgi:hypothetical protein